MLYFSVIFFFFKQKTAYEMRISDWSSDVCSSDLAALLTPTAVLPPRARAAVVSELSSTAKYGEPPAAAREALSWATLTASVSLTPAATCDRRRLRSVA